MKIALYARVSTNRQTQSQSIEQQDEVRQMPELFSTLRVLVDRPDNQAHFVILGSASPQLIRHTSESLAGRVEFIDLTVLISRKPAAQSGERSGCAVDFHALS